MENKENEKHRKLAKAVLKSIVDELEGDFKYTARNKQHLFYNESINEQSLHAFESGKSFIFSVRAKKADDQEKIMRVMTEQCPFDMTLYNNTMSSLSLLYQSLSFTVEPVSIKDIENFSWLSFFYRSRSDDKKYWENFDHFYYDLKLYPWKKNVINLRVTQVIKMIIVDDNGTEKYIPVMETSLPLNDSKRTKICISLDKGVANVYVLKKNGDYEIETIDNVLKMVNKGIRNYIFNILYQRHQIEISKSDFAILELDKYLKYVTLNEMAEI